MASRNPAQGAKKKATKPVVKPAKKTAPKARKASAKRATKVAAKAGGTVTPPHGKKAASPMVEMEWLHLARTSEHPFDRGRSIEGGIATLRQRLRASRDKVHGSRKPRAGREPAADQLDAMLKQLGESYRDPVK